MTKEETNAIKTFSERLGDWMLEEAEKERERQCKMIEGITKKLIYDYLMPEKFNDRNNNDAV